MGILTIQFDDDAIDQLAEKIAERMGGAEPAKTEKPSRKSKKDKDSGGAGTAEQIKELCTKLLDLTDKATVKEVTSEFECSTVGKACKLEGDEAAECIEALQEAIDKADDGGSSSDDDEITVEAVKIAVQAFSKKNGKEDTDEILKDFNIKSVRGLKTLEQSDLEELYAEVCE